MKTHIKKIEYHAQEIDRLCYMINMTMNPSQQERRKQENKECSCGNNIIKNIGLILSIWKRKKNGWQIEAQFCK